MFDLERLDFFALVNDARLGILELFLNFAHLFLHELFRVPLRLQLPFQFLQLVQQEDILFCLLVDTSLQASLHAQRILVIRDLRTNRIKLLPKKKIEVSKAEHNMADHDMAERNTAEHDMAQHDIPKQSIA